MGTGGQASGGGAPVQGGHFLKAELLRAGRIGLAEGFHKNAFGLGLGL
jgi:hypothetical protein